MNNDMDLSVRITGDASSAVSAADQASGAIKGFEGVSDTAIASLTAALDKLNLNFDAMGASAVKSATGVKSVGESAAVTTTFLEDMNRAGGAGARVFSALGSSAGEAAGRVEALTGVLGEMTALAPELLVIGAGIVAIGAAFTFFKDGIQNAEQLQQSMDQIKAAADEQGASWDSLKGKVKDFIDTESMASGISDTELAGALGNLSGRIHDVHDAMIIMHQAEIEHLATGLPLTEVTNALLEAEAGRGQSLAQLDPRLKDLIHHNAKLSEILKVLHEDNNKALQDQNNSAIAWERAKVAIEQAGEKIGDFLLPAVRYLAEALIGGIKVAQDLGTVLSDGFRGYIMVFIDSAKAGVEAAVGLWEAMHGNVKGAKSDMSSALKDAKGALGDVAAGANLATDAVKAFNDAFHMHQIGHSVVNEAIYKFDRQGVGQLDNDPNVGFPKNGGASGGFNGSQPIQAQTQDEKALTAAHTELANASGILANANKALTATFDPLMDSAKELAQKHQALNDAAYAAKRKIEELTPVVHQEEAAVKSSRAEVEAKYKAYAASTTALETLRKSLDGKTKLTSDEKRSVQQLTDEQKKLEEEWKNADKALTQHNTTLQHHLDLLNKSTAAIRANIDEQNKLIKEYNDSREANEKKNADERATYGRSLQDQIDYFRRQLENLDTFSVDYTKKKAELENKIADLQTKEYEKEIDEQKKAHDAEIAQLTQWADKAATLFNDFFTKGKNGFKSFSDAFKQMLDDMLLALEKSALLHLFEKIFGVNVGGGSSPVGGIGSLFGMSSATGGGSAMSGLASAGTLASLMGGSSSNGFASAGTLSSLMDSGYSVPGVSSGGGGSSLFLPGGGLNWGAHIGGAGGATLGSYALAAAGGAAIGQFVFGGKGYADVGGAIGGAAGLYFGGPIGAAIGAIAGSFLGSLFGNHFDPKNEPDIYQQDAWGQENANMVGGEWTASGKQYNPDQWTKQLTKGKGWNIVMEEFVHKFRGKTQNLPANLQGAFSAIEALWGGANGQAMFNTDGKDGYLDIGSGKRALWTDFYAMVQQYGPQIAQLMDSYQSANVYDAQGNTASLAGTYSPDGSPYILHDFPDFPGSSVSAPPSGGGGIAPPAPGPSGGGGGGNPAPIGGGGGGHVGREAVTVQVGDVHVHGSLIHQGNLANYISTIVADHMRMSYR